MYISEPIGLWWENADELAQHLRRAASHPEKLPNLIEKEVKTAKLLQRNNYVLYAARRTLLSDVLDRFRSCERGSSLFCKLAVLSFLLQLEPTKDQRSDFNDLLRPCLENAPSAEALQYAVNVFATTLAFEDQVTDDFSTHQIEVALICMKRSSTSLRQRAGVLILITVAEKTPKKKDAPLERIFQRACRLLDAKNTALQGLVAKLLELYTKQLSKLSLTDRESTDSIYMELIEKVRKRLRANSTEKNVSGLLLFQALVNSLHEGCFPLRYDDFTPLLAPYLEDTDSSKVPIFCEVLLGCLLAMCCLDKDLFIKQHLKVAIDWAFRTMLFPEKRQTAFQVLSSIIKAIEVAFSPYVESTCDKIRNVFEKSNQPCWGALECFSIICQVCPPRNLPMNIEACGRHVFRWGLSPQLLKALRSILRTAGTSYQAKLERALLDKISVTLCGVPFRETTVTSDRPLSKPSGTKMDIMLALNALIDFSFSPSDLMSNFLRQPVLPFIFSREPGIRNGAVKAIVKLLLPAHERDLTAHRKGCIDAVLDKMITTAVSHENPQVRQTIMAHFSTELYPHLSDRKYFHRIHCAVSDESILCEAESLRLLCRMAHYDISHISPVLTEVLCKIRQMIDCKYPVDKQPRECLRLLSTMFTHAPQHVVEFSADILELLLRLFPRPEDISFPMEPYFHAYIAVVTAVKNFGPQDRRPTFRNEISLVLAFLEKIPVDQSFRSRSQRLLCFRFLSAALSPTIDHQSPYQIYPDLFLRISSVLHDADVSTELRLEALKCLGKIGALDVTTFQVFESQHHEVLPEIGTSVTLTSSPDQTDCCSFVLQAICAIVDPEDKRYMPTDVVVRAAIVGILDIAFKCSSSHSSLRIVVSPLARVMRNMSGSSLKVLLSLYVTVLSIATEIPKEDGDEIFFLFNDVWSREPDAQYLVVHMISTLSRYNIEAVSSNRHSYAFIGVLLDSLNRLDSSTPLRFSIIVALIRNAGWLQPLCERVIGGLLLSIQSSPNDTAYVLAAVKALRILCLKLHVSSVMGSIIRQLLQLLSLPHKSDKLSAEVLKVWSVLRETSPKDFDIYSGVIMDRLKERKITDKKVSLAFRDAIRRPKKSLVPLSAREEDEIMKEPLEIIEKELKEVLTRWENRQIFHPYSPSSDTDEVLLVDDEKVIWDLEDLELRGGELGKWDNRFCLIVLGYSPYQVFRCVSIASDSDSPVLAAECLSFANEIAPLAFRIMWLYSSANLRDKLLNFFVDAFEKTNSESALPDEVMNLLLSIVEFMDHSGEPLGIAYSTLSECAERRGMTAKAVYWREAAYRENPDEEEETLINLYARLHMISSARGLFNRQEKKEKNKFFRPSFMSLLRADEALKVARDFIKVVEDEGMNNQGKSKTIFSEDQGFEHCHHNNIPPSKHFPRSLHSASLTNTSQAVSERDADRVVAVDQLMFCLDNLGDYSGVIKKWEELKVEADRSKTNWFQRNILTRVSEYAADACIRLQKWSLLQEILDCMPHDTVDYHITKAVRHFTLKEYSEVLTSVTAGRKGLLDFFLNIHESYARSYDNIILAQMLTELEEMIQASISYRDFGVLEPLDHIKELSKERLHLMAPNMRTWKQALLLHGLLMDPSNDVSTRISFIHLCRLENANEEEKFTLSQLSNSHLLPSLSGSRSIGNPEVRLEYITYQVNNNLISKEEERKGLRDIIEICSKERRNTLIARVFVRLGAISEGKESVDCYQLATLRDPKWHIGWRCWAEANAEFPKGIDRSTAVTSAIDGYIESILLSGSEVALIQDVLKLLTLCTTHGDEAGALEKLSSRVPHIPTSVWLMVVPQLIAHLGSGSKGTCHLFSEIATSVSLDYPNTLFFPLNLCRTSNAEGITNRDTRKESAVEIVEKMKERYPVLILQGMLVTEELTRLCTPIHERVLDKLREADSSFRKKKKIDETVQLLRSLHASLPSSPEGVAERTFLSEHGRDLEKAEQLLNVYDKSKDVVAIQYAWNIYLPILKKIEAQVKNIRTLDMAFYSPKLFEAHDLDFCLPDDHLAKGRPLSKISKFRPTLNVINSKQRPKRLFLTTSHGTSQKFLLKGKEDLRLDERVMQLFSLINIVMRSDFRSAENISFRVQQYTVTPLTETAGLIGWVDGCDTIYQLLQKYRKRKYVEEFLEEKLWGSLTTSKNPKFAENQTLIGKIEAMEYIADHTSGQDLRKVIWATAKTCEIWIDKRRRYMTSLANTSMVGYILGLGDRHPNNIMLQKGTGLIVHIDFGDCFEVLMTRERFPEKVPFRLTRMLRNALDVSDVGGGFRAISETSMYVLRTERDSVLAVLQAFIHDPLISWRLITASGSAGKVSSEDSDFVEDKDVHRLDGADGDSKKIADGTINGVNGGRSPTERSQKEIHSSNSSTPEDFEHKGTEVFQRLKSKLEGKDYTGRDGSTSNFKVEGQVSQLIIDATDISNLSQMWRGWMPYW